MRASGKSPLRRAITKARRWLRRTTHPLGGVSFGSLRRLEPLSDDWGFDRGLPVDRYYIEAFLEQHAADIRGRTLEVSNSAYTRRFGAGRVTHSDVLDCLPDNPAATLVADLTAGDNLPGDAFDCIICTQTLQFIFDVPSAIATLHRMLKPGGVLLATVPGISQISPDDMERSGDYWRFTNACVERLFARHFASEQLEIRICGNVLAAIGFLHGIAAQELSGAELDHVDANYQLLISIRAVKAGGT